MVSTIKTTILGGILFLIPFGVLLLVIGEVLSIAAVIATPLADLIPSNDILGTATASIISWILVLVVCYFAGRFAANHFEEAAKKTENVVSKIIPGYRLLKSSIAGMMGLDEDQDGMEVVEVHQFGTMRWAFEVERSADGQSVLVYYPGVPNPRAGSIQVVPCNQVRAASISPGRLMTGHQFFGRELLNVEKPNTPEVAD